MLRVRSEIQQPKFGLVRGAQPVRKIRPRIRRSSMAGWFPTIKGTLDSLRAESQIEMDGLELFETDPEIVLMAAQPHRLVYWAPLPNGDLVRRNYVPDLALLMKDGSVVIVDFKPARYAAWPSWKRKEALYRDAYALDHLGTTFLTVTDEMIAIEPRRYNARILMLHRPIVRDDEAEIAVMAHLDRFAAPVRLGELRCACHLPAASPDVDRAFSAVMGLVLQGLLRLDPKVRIDDDPIVSWREAPRVAPAAVST